MAGRTYALLEDRGLLAITGKDAREFLQGLVTNDVAKIGPRRAIYAALLTPQGKYLHDFFMIEFDGAILLECEAKRGGDLAERLGHYIMRAKVKIEDITPRYIVAVLLGDDVAAMVSPKAKLGAAKAFGGGVIFVDPRLSQGGVRAILPRATAIEKLEAQNFLPAKAGHYDLLRLQLGLPDGSRDLEIEKSTLLESGFDELNGLDWDKGCYLGQELTARTKYRGLVKKRLVPVEIEGPLLEFGATIHLEGNEVGEMRSSLGHHGIALMRIEALEKASGGREFRSGRSILVAQRPSWAAY